MADRRRLLAVVGAAALLAALLSPASALAGVDDLDSEEVAALEALNDLRVARGLQPLAVSPALTAAAEWMAADLAARDLLDHTDSLGREMRERFNALGYPSHSVIRENLAAGYETGAEVVDGWQGSPGHRANNEASDVRAVGIARVYRAGTTYGWFWALTLGSVEDPGTVSLDALTGATPPAAPVGTGPGTFSDGFPLRGFVLTAWNGGSFHALVDGARAGGATSLWATRDGKLVRYAFIAPAFVNAPFVALFPGGEVPAGTLLLVVV